MDQKGTLSDVKLPSLKPMNAITSQRRKQVAGLLLIALCILLASIWRAGLPSVFPQGWWRIW